VPAGTYEVTYHCAVKSTASTQTFGHSLGVSAGALTGSLIYAGTRNGTTVGAQSLGGAGGATLTLPQVGTGSANNLIVMTYRGTLNLSAAATFSLSWWLVSGTTMTLAAGSALRLVKIG
jgi:hypothetical protein